jgi:competence protein ComGC
MKILRSYIYLLIALVLAVLLILAVSGCNSQKHIIESRFDSTWTKNVQDSNKLLRHEVEKLTEDIQQLIYAGVYFDTVWLKGDTVRDTITNTVVIKTDGSIEAKGRISSAYVSKNTMLKLVAEKQKTIDSFSLALSNEKMNVKTVDRVVTKKTSFIPLYMFLIIAVLAAANIYFAYRRFK